MRRLRHRHDFHLAILIVVIGVEGATKEGPVHSCLINKLGLLWLREVHAILRFHAEREPLSVDVAPTLRQDVAWHIWTELVGAVKRPHFFKKHLFVPRVEIVPVRDILLAVDGFNVCHLRFTLIVVHELLIVDVKELRILRRPPELLDDPVFLRVIRIDDEGWQEVSQLNAVMQVVVEVFRRVSIWDVEYLCRLSVSWLVMPPEELDTGEEERQYGQD